MENGSIDFKQLFETTPGLYLILDPQLKIIAVNDSYNKATMTNREDIVGRGLFEVFPDNPEDKSADGASNLLSSLNYVLKHKKAHTMAVQKYDIRRPDGTFEERYWSPLNTPILNREGEISSIIHRV
jgi:PAS domain-containing protein